MLELERMWDGRPNVGNGFARVRGRPNFTAALEAT